MTERVSLAGRIVLVAMVVALAACLPSPSGSGGNDGQSKAVPGNAPIELTSPTHQSAMSPQAPLPGSALSDSDAGSAIALEGTPTSLEGGKLETPCYAVELDALDDYESLSSAEACFAWIKPVGGDAHQTISILPQYWEVSKQVVRELFESSGFELSLFTVRTVGGQPATVASWIDATGLSVVMAVVELPEGRYAYGGRAITSLLISGYALPNDPDYPINAMLDVMEIHAD